MTPKPRLSRLRFIRVSSHFFNLELGLVGFVSAFLVLLINFVGTGYIAWHAALIRLSLSIGYHLFLPKLTERLSRLGRSLLGRQFWANLVPNTLFNLIQYPIFVELGLPRPFWSVFPFWLIAVITFTQIVKHGRNGYEPGILDIAHGLWQDASRPFRRANGKA